MTNEEEEFVHFVSCIERLNKAWSILELIREENSRNSNEKNALIGPAFQYALIEYAKPYKQSYGLNIKKHQLPEQFIPRQYARLHRKLIESRDRIHAHDDLTVKDAKVHVSLIRNTKFVSILQNNIFGAEDLSMLDEIISLIECTLEQMYIEEQRLEALLPVTS